MGYHMVNVVIHWLTAVLVFLTILSLSQASALASWQTDRHFIALMAAALWALNPVHAQAVTYIVQRMACLAAMFYVCGLLLYIRARLSPFAEFRGYHYAGSMICFLLAAGSKENAILFPLAVLLLEMVFFQPATSPRVRMAAVWGGVALLGVLLFTAVSVFSDGSALSLLNGYGGRPFSLPERVMTQFRVLLFYLSQLFFPSPERLSLQHDIQVSTSLVSPWTTLPAIILVFSLIGLSVAQFPKRPVISFALLFFFLNHLVESTFLPLELIFEHRNYLPSLFLFWPVAIGIYRALKYLSDRRACFYKVAVSGAVCLLVLLGSSVYRRNLAWQTEVSLWSDVLRKAPGLARPHHMLALEYEKQGRSDLALAYYHKALTLKDQNPQQLRAQTLNNIGNIYLKRGEFPRAIQLYQKALAVLPGYERALHNLTLAQLNQGNLPQAAQVAEKLVAVHPTNSDYLNTLGFVWLKQNRAEDAVRVLEAALNYHPGNRNAAVNLAMALSEGGRYRQARFFLDYLCASDPNNSTFRLCAIEHALRSKASDVDQQLDALLSEISLGQITAALVDDNHRYFKPFSSEILAPAIGSAIRKKSEQLRALLEAGWPETQIDNRAHDSLGIQKRIASDRERTAIRRGFHD